MPTAPHQVLAALRELSHTEQMAVFAEALYMRSQAGSYGELPLVAAAYVLGRVDALKEGAAECAGSAGPMATAVLRAAGVLHERDHDDLPF